MHLEQLKSGSWRAVVSVGGVRKGVTAPTKGEARRLGTELELRMGMTPRANPKVNELIDAHLSAMADRWSPTTMADSRSVAVRLPQPFLDRYVIDVQPFIVEGLYRELADAGLSTHRIRRVHELLGGAWKRAVKYRWATSNVIRDVDPPRVAAGKNIEPPSPEDVARLMDAAAPDLRLFLKLASSTGARRGELVALQWGDIRFDTGEIVFRRSLAYTAASGVVERDTKTGRKGHRVVSVGLPTTSALRHHRREMVALALAQGFPEPVWVFSHDAGVNAWRPDYATLAFGRLRAKLGLENCRLHDLRHFVATQMLAYGDTPVQVAGRLGHSTPNITMSVYAHWQTSRDKEVGQRFDDMFGSG
jgi:integrase